MTKPSAAPFVNTWTLIGLKDYHAGTRVSAEWELVLGEGYRIAPRPAEVVDRPATTLVDGHLPIVEAKWPIQDGLAVTSSAFAAPLPGMPFDGLQGGPDNYRNFVRLTARNAGGEARDATLVVRVSRQLAHSVTICPELEPTHAGEAVEVATSDGFVLRLSHDRGLVAIAAGVVTVSATLAPAEALTVDVVAPHRPLADAAPLREGDFDAWRAATAAFWRSLLARGAQLTVPDTKAADTWRASLIYTVITRERGEPQPGQGFFDEFYVRDAAFITYALDVAGFQADARASLASFLKCQTADGAIISQRGQFDGTGQALWALASHCRLSGDRALLHELVPAMTAAAEWIAAMREDHQRADPDYDGLLPNSLSDGESLWGGEYHIVGYDLWALHGLTSLADALDWLGEREEANRWRVQRDRYRDRVFALLSEQGWRRLPPSYEGEGTDFLNLGMTFPTEIVEPGSHWAAETLEHAERSFRDGVIAWAGRAEGVGLPAVHPYLSSFVTQGRLARGEREVVGEQLAAMLAHTTSTHGFPEGVWVEHGVAWLDAVPHVFGAATFVGLLRRMLIYERPAGLHLLRGVPEAWLEGAGVRMTAAPTAFGRFDLEAGTAAGQLTVRLVGHAREELDVHFDLPGGLAVAEVLSHGCAIERANTVRVAAGDVGLDLRASRPPR